MARLELMGRKVNRLTVIGYFGILHGRPAWECLCVCGNKTVLNATVINRGIIVSCGCYAKEVSSARHKKHGHTCGEGESSEYSAWHTMKQRCNDPKHKAYSRYGGRGITVCEEWNNSFEAFFNDMGKKPTPKHSLDRKENNLGYYKENCRWATRLEQQHNRRQSVYVVYMGRKIHYTEAAKIANIKHGTLLNRITRQGWSIDKAMSTPVKGTYLTEKQIAAIAAKNKTP